MTVDLCGFGERTVIIETLLDPPEIFLQFNQFR